MADPTEVRSRILIVEDESMVRLMLGEMLTELGHEIVAEASRLERAIRCATEADYDVAVLDLNLGNGITYDVLDIVLRRGKALVVSTGYGQMGLGSKYDCVVLQKPFTREAISQAVQASLRQLSSSKKH